MNYKDTVFLPRTDFPMRAGLPKKEPEILQNWQQVDLYHKLRETRQGAPRFILHDGPPYANGQLHIGHALNKILKDIVNRSQSMLGKDANYVPGWDCHGLPIEWKIEEQYRKKAKTKTPCQQPNSVRNAGILPRIGWRFSQLNFKGLGCLVTGSRPTQQWPMKPKQRLPKSLVKF